ncbi:MAG: hypothetical protein NTY94_06670 [Alphaproteobacteria bacterium]|nr:hypothetical protein [Alphaproteobacteria bacterium]
MALLRPMLLLACGVMLAGCTFATPYRSVAGQAAETPISWSRALTLLETATAY